jgi:NAD(P)-dependent dehydrogenase (short-subunit alcohol dehydrogenase family)
MQLEPSSEPARPGGGGPDRGKLPRTVVVLGASRGLGRGIAAAFAGAGCHVVAVARDRTGLRTLASETSLDVRPCPGDATDGSLPARLVPAGEPSAVVLVAGAKPPTSSVHLLSWEEFSVNWHSDVQAAFVWVRAALSTPWPPNSQLVIVSSRAALGGSPISGGYAGAKATQRFLAGYAQQESERAGLGLMFTTVLPMLTPATELGQEAISAYAGRNQQSEAELVASMGPVLTPEIAGSALVDVVRTAHAADRSPTWELTGAGLQPVPAA